MVGVTLLEIREHVEALATPAGRYVVICGRTGERPIPVDGLRFPDRGTARSAARAAGQYRAALRRYDPQVPFYDLIVCEDADGETNNGPDRGDTPDAWALTAPVLDTGDAPFSRRDRVEFCHRVAAAVFETLSAGGYDGVETAVLDAYFDLAERLSDPDDLCLCLLESMAAELDDRLDPTAQTTVLAGAGARLAPSPSPAGPVSATFRRLSDVGLVERYTCLPGSIGRSEGPRTVVAELTSYALSPVDGRLPVLPVVVDLFRRSPERPPSATRARETEDGWHLALAFGPGIDPGHLASAPIRTVGRD